MGSPGWDTRGVVSVTLLGWTVPASGASGRGDAGVDAATGQLLSIWEEAAAFLA